MKLGSWLSLMGALACAPAVAADSSVAVETGPGDHWMKGAHGSFASYAHDLTFPNYPAVPGFYELSAGTWSGKYDNNIVAIAIGARARWSDFHLDASGGLAYAQHLTWLSNTHQQFRLRYGAGLTLGRFDVGVYETHFSNAKPIFGWSGKNVGYDFLTVQIGYKLK